MITRESGINVEKKNDIIAIIKKIIMLSYPLTDLTTFNTFVGALWLDVRADLIIFSLDFRTAGLLLCIQVQLIRTPHPVHLVGRGRIVLVASGPGPTLCVKRLGATVLRPVDADG